MLIDTHAHLQDEKYINIEEVVKNASDNNVGKIVCSSYDLNSSIQAIELSQKFEQVYATIGIHPEHAESLNDDVLNKLRSLSQHNKVTAIGEIGLDYHYENTNKPAQKFAFIKQIELAYELKLPIVIHSRDATGDMLEILREYKNKIHRAVLHCFSGSIETLNEIMKMGFYVSYGGVSTFNNARGLINTIKQTPIERIMLETDCPYLAPVPYRGKLNEPKYIPIIANKIAEIKDENIEKIEEITSKNAEFVYFNKIK